MKRLITLLLICLSLVGYTQEYTERLIPSVGTRAGFVAYFPAFEEGKTYPVLFVLHGIGERGDGGLVRLRVLADHGNYTPAERHGKQYGFIIVEPQTDNNWEKGEVEETYQWLKDSIYQYVNWKKVALTGTSLGGGGVYRYLSINPEAWKLFSAASPSGSGPHQYFVSEKNEVNVINTKVPTWAFHNKGDQVAPAASSTLYFFNKWKEQKGTAPMWVTLNDLNGHTFPAYNRGKGMLLTDGLKYVVGNGYVSMPKINLYEWILLQEIGKPPVAPPTAVIVTPFPAPGTPKPPVDTVPVPIDTIKPVPVDTLKPAPPKAVKRLNATGKVKYTLQYEDNSGSGAEEAVEVDVVKLKTGKVRITVRGAGKKILQTVEL